ncbi:S-methyl-5'-thioadenosine phosphorylase [Candidatus Woesearchaeota archaeon]|nr:S-methyl-5'-thioadenosine phosphorylase [Candidatus Woesearchaeota archaeon]
MAKIGIIGGSGLYNLKELQDARDIEVPTSYGKPSAPLRTGTVNGVEVVFLARHGKEHTIPPTQVNFRANIQALKAAGCTQIVATTACGSLKREIQRGDLVVLDQFIDFTRRREISFYNSFEPGKHGHTPMATPFSERLRNILIQSCQELQLKYHPRGTVVTIEGPRFSTKAESNMFARWGADVINMSIAPEAALANELKIPYAAVAMSTDYDCLFDDIMPVSHEEVLKVFSENVHKVVQLLLHALPRIKEGNMNGNINEKINGNIERANRKMNSFDLKSSIRTIPHWPKPGIMFRDITTLLKNPEAFRYCIQEFKVHYQSQNITKIAGIESRGFIFGAALAQELHLPFILIRKKGKLPAPTVVQEYQLEYGTDQIEVHNDAIDNGDRVLIIDDLIATGGTMLATCHLIEKLQGTVAGIGCIINLPDLKGIQKIKQYDPFWLVEFSGE